MKKTLFAFILLFSLTGCQAVVDTLLESPKKKEAHECHHHHDCDCD
jgi:hypothetical protein